jgi:hypothetical protein
MELPLISIFFRVGSATAAPALIDAILPLSDIQTEPFGRVFEGVNIRQFSSVNFELFINLPFQKSKI